MTSKTKPEYKAEASCLEWVAAMLQSPLSRSEIETQVEKARDWALDGMKRERRYHIADTVARLRRMGGL